MISDPSDFEALRRLMALKRHEQPPPGYFDRLPDLVLDRIERGEGKLSIWERFLSEFTFRPAFAYGFALAAFSALTCSVLYSAGSQPRESARTQPNNGWRTFTPDEAFASQSNPSEPLHVPNWTSDANPSNPAPILPSLFGAAAHSPAVPVSFATP